MNVKQAKELAIQWVNAEACNMPGYYGAYFAGSINWMADEDPFPVSSDLDIKIVLDTVLACVGYKLLSAAEIRCNGYVLKPNTLVLQKHCQ